MRVIPRMSENDRLVYVGSAAEQHSRDDGRLEQAALDGVLGDVERDRARRARDPGEDARRGRVQLIHLRIGRRW